MKARVRATGEIVDVEVWIKHIACYRSIFLYRCGGIFYEEKSLDFENLTEGLVDVKEKSFPKDEPNYWEKLRHQYTGMAMQGILANPEMAALYDVDVAATAIRIANITIEKLKEESQCEK